MERGKFGLNTHLDRRQALWGALKAAGIVAAHTLLPKSLEAQEIPITYLESSLSPETIELHKKRAAESLRASIPPLEKLAYLWGYAEHLEEESQMYLPDSAERGRVILNSLNEKGESQLDVLAQQLTDGETGIYVFADKDEDGRHFHRTYVIKKEGVDKIRFEKGYKVSMSDHGFGDDDKSGKTPLGLERILSGEVGRFAQVLRAERLSEDKKKRKEIEAGLDKNFTKAFFDNTSQWFARTFGEPSALTWENRMNRDRSEIVTARYTIDEQRGVHFHGTNRSGMWDKVKNAWITFLGGRRRSSGCIRMSNTDIYDLGMSRYISLPQKNGKKIISHGTSVMIHATPEAKNAAKQVHPDDKERNLFEEVQVE